MGRRDERYGPTSRRAPLIAPLDDDAPHRRPGKADGLASELAAAVLSTTPQSIVIADRKGRIIAANPAFFQATGFAIEDICGRDIGALQSGRDSRDFLQDIRTHVERRGHWRGEICARRKNDELYSVLLTVHPLRDKNRRITHFVATSAEPICADWSNVQPLCHTQTDEVTGLANRSLVHPHLDETIAKARRGASTAAALIIDLDRFDTVKDSLGHEAGDELLAAVSGRLRGRLRRSFLARLGGDKFLVVQQDLDAEAAAALADELIGSLAERFVLSVDQDVYIGASVGVAVFPDHGTTSHELIQHAEAALHQAKSAGEGVCRLYSDSLTRTASARLTLDAKMRRALERGEFELYYQPIWALADRTIAGVEALLRWNEPSLGLVHPNEFIAVAEETGVIVPITDWVLRTACMQMKSWLTQGVSLRTMAANVSAKFFQSGDVVARLAQILEDAHLPGRYLELELTEGVLLENTAALRNTMSGLKRLGLRLAIDDFGTGYSSLGYLKRLPIDKLKIDRVFICDLPDDRTAAQITSAIIALGNALELQVVAEGVETERQVEFLRERGLLFGQGHLLSPPAPAAALVELLTPGRTRPAPQSVRKSAARRSAPCSKDARQAGR